MTQKFQRITAVHANGMVNIDSDNLSYANIQGLYKAGDGHGLQINDETKRTEAEKLCALITDSLSALNKLMATEE